jgi:hypothetical protein
LLKASPHFSADIGYLRVDAARSFRR